MLSITIGTDLYDETTGEFVIADAKTLRFEHSLISLSKWESKHKVPFLSDKQKTSDQVYDYLKMMLVDKESEPEDVHRCTQDQIDEIQNYIDSSESATTFGEMPKQQRSRGETITSELIYYWLVAFNIPFEVEDWHLNRLFSLIRICNVKNQPAKKMSRNEIAQRNRDLNARRRAELGTSG